MRKVYHKLLNSSTGGSHHPVDTPRNHDQVRNLLVYGKKFVLGGCSVHSTGKSCGHFTAVIYLHNKPYYYDGLQKTKEQRFVKFHKKYER